MIRQFSGRLLMSAAGLAAMLGCSSAPTNGFTPTASDLGAADDAGDDGGTPSTGSGSSGGSGSPGTSSGGSTANVPVDAAAPKYSDASFGHFYDTYIPDAEVAETKTLTIAPFQVAAGDEVFMCQQFANPFGEDVNLVKMDGQMSTGSHHFFVFNMSPATLRNTAAPIAPCPGAGLEFHPYIYLSQQPNWTVTYPEADMGYPLPSANGLMMNVHFLNATSAPITAQATITMTVAKSGAVTKLVGNLFLNNGELSVPANIPKSSPVWYPKSTTPISDHNYEILQSWSHMHQWAVDFQASMGPSGSAPFYEETNWDTPQIKNHNPPLQVASGTPINWQCQYYNDTGATLTFGDSAKSNVMCIYFGMYYPVTEATSDPNYPDIVTPL
jgi:hypothetical protein